MTIADETLMAYADGALDSEGRAAVEAALARDPALADRLAVFLATPGLLAPLDRSLDEPIPDALARLTLGRPQRSERPERPAAAPAATTLATAGYVERLLAWLGGSRGLATGAAGIVLGGAIVIALLPGYGSDPDSRAATDPVRTVEHDGALDTALVAALNELPSGEERTLGNARRIGAVMTIEAADGQLCREFADLQPRQGLVRGLACRAADGSWQLRASVASAVPADSGADFRPASSDSTAFDELVEALAPGSILAADAEARLIARGWRR